MPQHLETGLACRGVALLRFQGWRTNILIMLSILHSLNSVVQPYDYYFQVALGEANVHVDAVVM